VVLLDLAHSLRVSETASFSTPEPVVTGVTLAPSSCMRFTLLACLSMSLIPMKTSTSSPTTLPAMAVARPCCPAAVSVMSLVFPILLARRACPRVLLSLWEPPVTRSSLFRYTLQPVSSLSPLAW